MDRITPSDMQDEPVNRLASYWEKLDSMQAVTLGEPKFKEHSFLEWLQAVTKDAPPETLELLGHLQAEQWASVLSNPETLARCRAEFRGLMEKGHLSTCIHLAKDMQSHLPVPDPETAKLIIAAKRKFFAQAAEERRKLLEKYKNDASPEIRELFEKTIATSWQEEMADPQFLPRCKEGLRKMLEDGLPEVCIGQAEDVQAQLAAPDPEIAQIIGEARLQLEENGNGEE